MTEKICLSCSSSNRFNAKFCRLCGAKLPSDFIQPQQTQETVLKKNNETLAALPQNDSTVESSYIGLDEIKRRLTMFIGTLSIRQRQKQIGMDVADSTNIFIFKGETGTGKSLVADCFISDLQKAGCLSSTKIQRTTAHKFQKLYPNDSDIARYLSEQNLGILLIDEIQTDVCYLQELLLGLSEKKSGTICILLGIKEDLDNFFVEKEELADLVTFYDFPSISDEDLGKILGQKLSEKGFIFDEDVENSFLPCVMEAHHSETALYKNGWLVEKEIMSRIAEKQAARLGKMQHITEEDLKRIVPEDLPTIKKIQSVEEILSMLDDLIGMESVKKAVRELCYNIQNNLKRISLGIFVENPKIHIVLTGNPGTGKTTVARILGKLFYAMRLLPSDKVLETSGLDLTAGFVGQTKDKVNEICDKAMGGVLFVDEAYYLAGTDGNASSYGSEAVGTLLKRMEDDRGKFVIIAAGYQNEMQNFLRMNQGLESRFEHKIHIEDYNAEELYRMLLLRVKKVQFIFDEKAKKTAWEAIENICKNKGKDFANGRTVRNLFNQIKICMDNRLSKFPAESLTKELLTTIISDDIPHEEKKELTADAVFAELNELIGMENVKAQIRELYDTIKINREMEKLGTTPKKPEIHIALTGNPGTGKTTVARLLGKLFYSIGLLSSDKVIETDRSKIVAKFLGHTAPNMQRYCDDATGGILFIDEVYTLSTDDYGREATDTLMKRMEDDRGKFVVVVAGYENKMQEWMQTNEGLSSRFTHHIHIEDYNPDELFALFCLYAKKENITLTDNAQRTCYDIIHHIFQNKGTDFANGRTVRKIFDSVVRKKNSRVILLPESERTKDILTTIEESDFDLFGAAL